MKKGVVGLLLLSIIVGCLGVVNAGDTSCWEGKGTVPTTTYASGIVYGCDGEIPIITIYGDNGNGKSFGITIKAMNEGTGTVTIGSLNDTGAYGSLYQWGNNYPFPNVAQGTISNISSSGVDASGYGPGKYNSGTWINRYQRDISNNRNLWGGSGDIQSSNGFWGFDVENFIVINAGDRIGMCDTGYHIPSVGERNALIYLWGKNSNIGDDLDINKLNSISQTSVGTKFSNDVLIPFAGFRVRTSVDYPGYQGYYWTSSLDRDDAYYFIFYPDSLYFSSFYTRAVGFSVRCFKNEYVKHSYSLIFDTQGGSEVNTGIAEENTSWDRPDDPTKSGYIFVDWYTSTGYDTVFDFTTLATGDLTVYAKWGCETGYKDNGTECVLNKDIVIEATSTAANQTLKINKYFANAYIVDWGDGTTGNVTADTGHTYSVASGYTITLSPSSSRWTFQNITKPLIPKNGTTMTGVKIIYMPSLADGFGNNATAPGNNFFRRFNNEGAITQLPEGSFDTSNIITIGTNYFYGFNYSGSLTSLPKGSFRLSTGLTVLGDSFFGEFNLNGQLRSLPEGSFDTSHITTVGDNFFRGFNYSGSLVNLSTGSFDISNIVAVGNYFFYCFNYSGLLTSLPKGSFRLSTGLTIVKHNFFSKFNQNGQLRSLSEGSFDTSHITTVGDSFFEAFNQVGQLINLPNRSFRLSTGLTAVGHNFFRAFNSRGQLRSLPEGSFDTSHITTVGDYFFRSFNNQGPITGLPEGSFDTSHIIEAGTSGFYQFNYNGYITSIPTSFTVSSGLSSQDYGYSLAFNSPNYTINRKVSDLVSGITVPESDRNTFSDNQPGRCGVHENWLVTTADACSISYDDGLGGTGEFKYTADTTGVVAGSGMVEPEKLGYIFSGWIDASGNNIEEVIFPDMDGQTLYANWMPNEYAIVFVDGSGDNESVIYSGKYNLAVEVQYPNWTKEGYTIHWDKEIPATMPLSGEMITASWIKKTKPSGGSSGGGGGGGGGGGSSSSCKNLPANVVANNSSTPSSNTNYYYSTNTSKVCTFQCKSGYTRNAEKETCDKASDTQTTSGTTVKESEGTGNNTKVETGNKTEIQTGSKIDSQPAEQASEQTHQNDNSNTQDSSTSSQNDGKTYSTEFQEAYEFAKGNGITTMSTIQKANMNGKLTRIAMAKMLSQYAMNVLGQKPANIVTPKFNDVTDKQNSDYDGGVTLSYQLGIMGQNMPNNRFRPNDEVTRAEFATALSRMVYHTSDGEYKSTPKYYIHHMEKLVKEGIITKDDPEMKELRGYVMIMLMRSAK